MNWLKFREYQGNWQREVVLVFDTADRDDPFLTHRIEQYREIGKVVRLMPLDRLASNPQQKDVRHEVTN
jgi:hypothetical protein